MLKVQTTFWSGDTHSTIDYVMVDVDAASWGGLSEHLWSSTTLNHKQHPTDTIENANDSPTRIDWTKAKLGCNSKLQYLEWSTNSSEVFTTA